jgi:hypothetical protein
VPPPSPGTTPLLLVIDPAARRGDGESVRIAKDVLCAGAAAKVCFPEDPGEVERVLAHRGSKRPVVVGDDRAFLRTARLLHRSRELADCALAVVPVGPREQVSLIRGLGVPPDPVAASRAVLDGVETPRSLLADEDGDVVFGALTLPASELSSASLWSRVYSSVRPAPLPPLRVEADGALLGDLRGPDASLRVTPSGTTAEVMLRPAAGSSPVQVEARWVRVTSEDLFRYRADTSLAGPFHTRTWTPQPRAWHLTLPR